MSDQHIWELNQYVRQNIIDTYKGVISEGKEAVIHLTSKTNLDGVEEHFAIKVYKQREFRSFKNRSDYTQPIGMLQSSRVNRAMRKRSRKGLQMEELEWQTREVRALQQLQALGVRVPRLIKHGANSFVMEFIGIDDLPAPKLVSLRRQTFNSELIFKQIIDYTRTLLMNHMVHGDLSAYNILLHHGEAVLIDFPQWSDPRLNDRAFALLKTDLENVCRYFSKQGVDADAAEIFKDLRLAYERIERMPI